MGFHIESHYLNGVVTLLPDVFSDKRGFFTEAFRADSFAALGLPAEFRQINHSGSHRGVVRGLHFQWDEPMGKLLRVTAGAARIIEVDIRPGSPTLGKWCSIDASTEDRRIVWVPPGFANGFAALSEWVEVQYLCTAIYNPAGETAIRWNDPALAIEWGIENPLLSDKDVAAQTLVEWLAQPESLALKYPENRA
jgi:dTDP-4-dehydrorhamnose 3,5-epimerase